MDDGPDQDPMVPSSRAIVVHGLLSQRRWNQPFDTHILSFPKAANASSATIGKQVPLSWNLSDSVGKKYT
ncbi:hypothetical protein MA16_Dca013667 [Dendrobium catenatum]|uniref:Uncharacterized protein n=1 Tax=Dendrobium catenatum TaxID=906689 RepID=A0A2I0WPH5_9ASPA|nr:hypothetical protein MA16_Dca013667 [Dendrobium catenatum]